MVGEFGDEFLEGVDGFAWAVSAEETGGEYEGAACAGFGSVVCGGFFEVGDGFGADEAEGGFFCFVLRPKSLAPVGGGAEDGEEAYEDELGFMLDEEVFEGAVFVFEDSDWGLGRGEMVGHGMRTVRGVREWGGSGADLGAGFVGEGRGEVSFAGGAGDGDDEFAGVFGSCGELESGVDVGSGGDACEDSGEEAAAADESEWECRGRGLERGPCGVAGGGGGCGSVVESAAVA